MSNIQPNKIQLIEGYAKIAAGEVIERPASVVKELIENSIDAGASRITVNIKNAGKDLIEIIDDGMGIPKDQVATAFLRHTSSKIKNADELESVLSLGFRGEALCSIAAVSKLEIITRTQDQENAVKLIIEEGKIIDKLESGGPVGTTFKIRNLFYNLPVRRKFLKKEKTELAHIRDILGRYTIAHPEIHFKLSHNSLMLINSPQWIPNPDLNKKLLTEVKLPLDAYAHSIKSIYGKKIMDQMFPIETTGNDITLYGYIGHPDLSRSKKNASSMFVNKRLVVHEGISDTIGKAYKEFMMINQHPFFILFFEIAPDKIDVNIHPSKKIIKFLDETELLVNLEMILRRKITDHFNTQNERTTQTELIQKMKQPHRGNIGGSSMKTPNSQPNISINTTTSSIRSKSGYSTQIPSVQNTPNQSVNQSTQIRPKQTHFNTETSKKEPITSNNELQQSFIHTNILPELNKLSTGIQAGKTYLIFQNEEGLVIIDQHAADERINLEKVRKAFEIEKMPMQSLLTPIKIEVPLTEVDFVKKSLPELKKLGFNLEEFGGNIFLLREIPSFLKNVSNKLIIDMALEIFSLGHSSTFTKSKDMIMNSISCRMSIMAGDEIWNEKKFTKLIQNLDLCENPHSCAHGRPTYIKIPFSELEKRFHRTG